MADPEKNEDDKKLETEKIIEEAEKSELKELRAEVERLKKANDAAARFMRDKLLNGDGNSASEATPDEVTAGVEAALKILRGKKEE